MKLIPALATLLLVLPSAAFSAQRIITIGGSVTETAYALGMGERIVACDTSSTWPRDAQKKPKVGYARSLSAEGILSFNPDLVLVSNLAGPPEVLAKVRASGVRVETLSSPPPVAHSLDMIIQMGRLLNVQTQAKQLRTEITTALKELPGASDEPLRVLTLIGGSGGQMMAAGAGTRADAMLTLAGVHNVANEFNGYRPIGMESLIRLAPDAIVVPDHALAMLGGTQKQLLAQPAIAATPAGRNGHLVIMDGLLLLGMGPRLADAALQLQHKLQQPQSVTDAKSGATPTTQNKR